MHVPANLYGRQRVLLPCRYVLIYFLLQSLIILKLILSKLIAYEDCAPTLIVTILFLGAFAALFAVIGLIFNVTTIAALKTVSQTDMPTLFVISLCVSDLVMCCFILPLQSTRFFSRYFKKSLCGTFLHFEFTISIQ